MKLYVNRLFRFTSFFVFLFLLTFGFQQTQQFIAQAQVTPPVRIMVVGDSISHGHAGDYTWRYRLWQHLTADTVSFDMVGPKNTVSDGTTNYIDPNFDRDHDATWGRALTSVPLPDGSINIGEADTIASEVTVNNPDILLVNIGTNDLAWLGLTGEQVAQQLTNLITNARSAKSDIKIVLSKITPRAGVDANYTARWTDYNERISSLAVSLSTPSSPIVVADPVTGFDPAVDTYDGTHPAPSGEFKIAKGFVDALSSGFGIGTAYGAIPQAPVWPLAPTGVVAQPLDAGMKLDWNAAIGVDSYYIYMRNVTRGEQFVQLPYSVNGTTFTGGWMYNGETYEFAVASIRGNVVGPMSNIVQVIPQVPLLPGPTNLKVKPGNGGMLMTWDPIGTSWYYIYHRNVTRNEAFSRFEWPDITNSFNGAYMYNGETYEFKVTTINTAGIEGPFSATIAVIPVASVTGLTVAGGVGNAQLSWQTAVGATSYNVYRKDVTANESLFTKIASSVAGTTYTANTLTNGHIYQFQMSPVNSTGEGDISASVSATPNALAVAPNGLTATAGTAGSKKITLNWNAVLSTSSYTVTGYQVWYKDTNVSGSTFQKWSTKTTAISSAVTGLVANHIYQFKVTTVNFNNAEGPYSATVSKKAP